jgi:hypothetical protein
MIAEDHRVPLFRRTLCPVSEASAPADCPLCVAEQVTMWHFEDDECWVADCLICSTPMVVWRPHGLPGPDLEERLLSRLAEAATARYGVGGFWIDAVRRRIPDHWHAHARPQGGFFDPRGRINPSGNTH